MTGSYDVEVWNSRVKFKLHISDKITILGGDSGTGKTTLISMISKYDKYGENSGITIKSEVPCMAMDTSFADDIHNDTIVFIDEDEEALMNGKIQEAFIDIKKRASIKREELKEADVYIVVVTRDAIQLGNKLQIGVIQELKYNGEYIYNDIISR